MDIAWPCHFSQLTWQRTQTKNENTYKQQVMWIQIMTIVMCIKSHQGVHHSSNKTGKETWLGLQFLAAVTNSSAQDATKNIPMHSEYYSCGYLHEVRILNISWYCK